MSMVAATVEPSVAFGQLEGIERPVFALRLHDVEMIDVEHRTRARAAAKPDDDAGAVGTLTGRDDGDVGLGACRFAAGSSTAYSSSTPLAACRRSRPPRLMSPRPMNDGGKCSRGPSRSVRTFTYFPVAMLPSRTIRAPAGTLSTSAPRSR